MPLRGSSVVSEHLRKDPASLKICQEKCCKLKSEEKIMVFKNIWNIQEL